MPEGMGRVPRLGDLQAIKESYATVSFSVKKNRLHPGSRPDPLSPSAVRAATRAQTSALWAFQPAKS